MGGPVDFNKTVEYWQQDKWTGCFPVKWHIIKDVPNISLRHIILENNENKPVTNSRDTQEVFSLSVCLCECVLFHLFCDFHPSHCKMVGGCCRLILSRGFKFSKSLRSIPVRLAFLMILNFMRLVKR